MRIEIAMLPAGIFFDTLFRLTTKKVAKFHITVPFFFFFFFFFWGGGGGDH